MSSISALPVAKNRLREHAEEFMKDKPETWILAYLTGEGKDTMVHFKWGKDMQFHHVVGLLECAKMEVYKDE